MKKLYLMLLTLTISLLISITGLSAQADASVRFAHAIPGAAAIDIYVNNELTVSDLQYGQASSYINVPASDLRITVTPSDTTSPLWQQTYAATAGKAFTLVASSFAEPVAFTAFEDQLNPLELGKARFTTIHAIADGAALDITLDDGSPLVLQQSYNQPYGTLDVPVFSYNLRVIPSGEAPENAIITLDNTSLNTNTSYMLLVYGTNANPQALLLSAATQPVDSTAGYLKLVNSVTADTALDVYLNDGILAAVLAAPGAGNNATQYLALPSGDYVLELRASGTQDVLYNDTITVTADSYTTVITSGEADSLQATVLDDALSQISSDDALLRVFNAGDDAISVSLSDGTLLASDLAAGTNSEILSVTPSTLSVSLLSGTQSQSLAEQPFYGGTFYDVVINPAATENSIIAAALAQTVGSAADTVNAPQLPDTTTEEAVQEPTAEPVVEEATPEQVAVEPTVIPQATLAPAPTQVLVPTQAAIIGRVFNLNVDANLHLRQYPDTQALSLATVPFGTQLTVNGRGGEIMEILSSATQVPEDYEYVDPVHLLESDRDDLTAEDTWINVTYSTPDGGAIEAWVRADFVDIRDAAGKKIALRDLETVPSNQPGEAVNTDIAPPTAPENIVTVNVINLDSGANLNVRRTPDTLAEVLVQLPLGSTAEFLGIDENQEWVLLRYTASDGTTTTGWASINFLQPVFRGNNADLTELEERDLLTIADPEQRGDRTIGAVPVVAATPNPITNAIVAEVTLDPGANLNLRRNPDTTAEILAQIPSGTQVIVSARTEDSQWLNVTYEGLTGWIAAQTDTAQFVVLTLNGNPADYEEIPLTAEE